MSINGSAGSAPGGLVQRNGEVRVTDETIRRALLRTMSMAGVPVLVNVLGQSCRYFVFPASLPNSLSAKSSSTVNGGGIIVGSKVRAALSVPSQRSKVLSLSH